MIPMILFIIIAFLGGFHVISVETTAWGFAVWFVIMIARAGMSRVDEEGKGRIDILVPPMGLGGAIFDRSLPSLPLKGNEEAPQLPAYDEPMACYPETMRHE